MMLRFAVPALFLALSITACGGKGDDPAAAGEKKAIPAVALAKAEEVFNTRCVPCHGAQGHGDGSASATLNPKPRNFGDADWQKSVTDDHIKKIIKVGGAGVGKSAAMPSNPDLINDNVLTALKDKIRNFGGK